MSFATRLRLVIPCVLDPFQHIRRVMLRLGIMLSMIHMRCMSHWTVVRVWLSCLSARPL